MYVDEEYEYLVKSLEALCLKSDDTILVHSDLSMIGYFSDAQSVSELCEKYFLAIKEVIGDKGTVVVPTYSTQIGRKGGVFDAQNTKSVTGAFSEHVRKKSNAIRSGHPLHSLTAIGRNADLICGNYGLNNYGWGSPMHSLHKINCKVLSIGLPAGYCLSIAHYVEAMLCVPYVYNKLLEIKVKTGQEVRNSVFTASVRYLDLNFRLEFSKWLSLLCVKKQISGRKCGRGNLFLTTFCDAFDAAAEQMKHDPFFLIDRKPNFTKGRIPFDGATLAVELSLFEKDKSFDRLKHRVRLNDLEIEKKIILENNQLVP